MRDSLGRQVFRWQVGIRLSDGTYTAPTDTAPTPGRAVAQIMRRLHREGRSEYWIERYRQLRVDGTAATDWVPYSRSVR